MKWIDMPPVWLLGFLVLVYGVAWIDPFTAQTVIASLWPGRALIAIGLALMVWAAVTMIRARTTVIPHRDPAALVTSGPFAVSRNPIYLADALILSGWALILGSLIALPLVALFVVTIEKRFINAEEARLQAGFGTGYTEWAARVRRWF